MMVLFDTAMATLLLLFLVRGAWVGLIGQLAFLVALVLGFMAAGAFYGDFTLLIGPWIKQPHLAFLVTYLILFLGVYLVVMVVGRGLHLVMNITMLTWFDRLMGGLFGAIKGIFVASLVFMGLAGFISSSRPILRDSFSYPFLAVSSGYILMFIRDNDLRERFLPREPAITNLLLPAVPEGEAVRGAAEQIGENDNLVP
jgi:membrane protein required for colicin V production